jgi:SAM-dependent methyltransferase
MTDGAHLTRDCPNCGAAGLRSIYNVSKAPVHSVLLFEDRDEAVGFPTGQIDLASCDACGFMTNAAFDLALEQYGAGYEATQAFSATFNNFHKHLAEDIIERHGLHGKEVIEIGCGQGEFLAMLCDLGGNKGVGFDPAYDTDRSEVADKNGLTFVADHYSEKYADQQADFVACKMTLEHIPDTLSFMRTVRKSIGDRAQCTVFFMVPNADYILKEGAFWDVYYEHCSYFTPQSLTTLFEAAGFAVENTASVYDDQYLCVTACPADVMSAPPVVQTDMADQIAKFKSTCDYAMNGWGEFFANAKQANKKVALWGGGSKAVSFLTTLGLGDEIDYVIDINPHKWDTYLPMSGHAVYGPAAIRHKTIDTVIVMNPIYFDEVRAEIAKHGKAPKVLPITEFSRQHETDAANA